MWRKRALLNDAEQLYIVGNLSIKTDYELCVDVYLRIYMHSLRGATGISNTWGKEGFSCLFCFSNPSTLPPRHATRRHFPLLMLSLLLWLLFPFYCHDP